MRTFILALTIPVFALAQAEPAQRNLRYQATDCGPFEPRQINKYGQITGATNIDGTWRVVLCDQTGTYDLGPGMNPAINDKGDIAATAVNGGGYLRYADGRTISLGSMVPNSINTARQVVGYALAGSVKHAALWERNSMFDLGETLFGSAVESVSTGINDEGMIVGYSWNNDATRADGFLYDRKLRVIENPFQLGLLYPASINNEGTVAGWLRMSSRIHPFVWRRGVLTRLPEPGVVNFASSINERGEVVGYALDYVAPPVAVLWEGGIALDLSTLLDPPSAAAWSLTSASAINQAGQIAATALDSTGLSHAVLLTPKE